jgi:hypothetical protein
MKPLSRRASLDDDIADQLYSFIIKHELYSFIIKHELYSFTIINQLSLTIQFLTHIICCENNN